MTNKDRDDHEAEVLGRMLRWQETLAIASLYLKDAYFRSFKNALVFDVAITLWHAGKPVDLTTVAHEIYLRGKTEDAPKDYLYQLWDGAPTPANMEYYCQQVRDFHIIESLKGMAAELGQAAENPSGSAEELLQNAERKILDIALMGSEGETTDLGEEVGKAFARYDARAEAGLEALGVMTGFSLIDQKTSGLRPARLITIAARTSVGKSALAGAIARHASRTCRVLFVSLEMSREELADRIICAEAGVDFQCFNNSRCTDEEVSRLQAAEVSLRSLPITFDDKGNQNALRIAASARRLQKKGLGIVIIDYLQLILPENEKDQRYQQVGRIMRRLKGLAKELNVPIVVLAQLNREADSNNPPKLSQLYESGSIEQDSDIVMLLHQPNEHSQLIEVNIAKNRGGPKGIVNLEFRKRTMQFIQSEESEIKLPAYPN